MNGIAKFDCGANGNPPPSVFWTKEGSQELMFAGTTHGQMFVSEDGTLTIQVTRSCFCSDLGKHFSILCYVSANKRFAFVRVFYLELEQTYRQKTFCIGSRDSKEAKEKKKIGISGLFFLLLFHKLILVNFQTTLDNFDLVLTFTVHFVIYLVPFPDQLLGIFPAHFY